MSKMFSFLQLLVALVAITARSTCSAEFTSQGTYFAYAAPHSSYTAQYGTDLIFTAKVESTVTIEDNTGIRDVIVPAGGSATYTLPHSLRVTDGVENKAVHVTSDFPISVYASADLYAGPRIPDATQLRPVSGDDKEAILASFGGDAECDRVPRAFYSVVGTQDDTSVQVYRKSGGNFILDSSFVLGAGDVFTRDASTEAGQNHLLDYSGGYVTATHPVATYSGHGCVVNPGQVDWINQYYLEAMPSMGELGANFVTAAIALGADEAGYTVRVIGASNNTVVDVNELGINVVIGAGDFYEFQTPSAHTAYKVSCSVPCLAVQYSKETRETGGPHNLPVSGFMSVLTAEGLFSDDLVFSTLELSEAATTTTLLSLVVFESPVNDLYLDGNNLDTLSWQTVTGTTHSYATVEIDDGVHHLLTTNIDNRFAAYVHSVDTAGNAISLGYSIGYGVRDWTGTTPPPTTTTPTPTTTTPPGDETRNPPHFKVILLGNFTSSEDYTIDCADAYNDNLRAAATEKIPNLNAMLGDELCSRFQPDDFILISVSTAFKAEANTGSTEVTYIMNLKNHLAIEEVYECATELNNYLQDFSNWGTPVIPPVEDCPHPVFNPNQFFDGSTGRDWMCLDFQVSPSDKHNSFDLVRDPPGYSLSLYDNFTTVLNEELDTDCTRTYTNDWETKAIGMVITLNGKLDSSEICPHLKGRFSLLTATTAFTSQGYEGSIAVTFYTTPTNDTVRFEEVYVCIDEMFDFLKDHSNWGTFPLLPQPDGCPLLVFNPAEFYHSGEKWECPPPHSNPLTGADVIRDVSGDMWQWMKKALSNMV